MRIGSTDIATMLLCAAMCSCVFIWHALLYASVAHICLMVDVIDVSSSILVVVVVVVVVAVEAVVVVVVVVVCQKSFSV